MQSILSYFWIDKSKHTSRNPVDDNRPILTYDSTKETYVQETCRCSRTFLPPAWFSNKKYVSKSDAIAPDFPSRLRQQQQAYVKKRCRCTRSFLNCVIQKQQTCVKEQCLCTGSFTASSTLQSHTTRLSVSVTVNASITKSSSQRSYAFWKKTPKHNWQWRWHARTSIPVSANWLCPSPQRQSTITHMSHQDISATSRWKICTAHHLKFSWGGPDTSDMERWSSCALKGKSYALTWTSVFQWWRDTMSMTILTRPVSSLYTQLWPVLRARVHGSWSIPFLTIWKNLSRLSCTDLMSIKMKLTCTCAGNDDVIHVR